MMYDWAEMAAVVGRKLVENGQTRILQRIYEGVTSDLLLDTWDYKESDNHQLLHLVWRKFPRNRRPPMDGKKTIISHSTQTEEVSGIGLNKTSKNSIISDADCFSASDLRGLYDPNESAEISESLGHSSDAGWTSNCTLSSTDLVAQEGAKGHSRESGRKSPLIGFEAKKSRRKKKKEIKGKKMSAENSLLDAPSSSGYGGVIPPSEVPDEVKDAKQQAMDTALLSLFQKANYMQDKIILLNSALAEAKRPP